MGGSLWLIMLLAFLNSKDPYLIDRVNYLNKYKRYQKYGDDN